MCNNVHVNKIYNNTNTEWIEGFVNANPTSQKYAAVPRRARI